MTDGVTFSVDVENHLAPVHAARFPAMTRRLLDFLGARGIAATFFVEGQAVRQAPALVREITAAGHEVGSHGYHHGLLARETPDAFAAGMADARARLQDLSGQPVLGFRAPVFSLVPAARWVTETLARIGFAYSSSVVPGPALIGGYPGAPCRPFVWPSGLLEIPCPVGRIGRWTVPFQGGMYMRYLPPWRYRMLSAQLGRQTNWTYCHPYDIDTEEPFSRVPGCGLFSSALIWLNRRPLLRRWERLAAEAAPPFGARLDALRKDAPPFAG